MIHVPGERTGLMEALAKKGFDYESSSHIWSIESDMSPKRGILIIGRFTDNQYHLFHNWNRLAPIISPNWNAISQNIHEVIIANYNTK